MKPNRYRSIGMKIKEHGFNDIVYNKSFSYITEALADLIENSAEQMAYGNQTNYKEITDEFINKYLNQINLSEDVESVYREKIEFEGRLGDIGGYFEDSLYEVNFNNELLDTFFAKYVETLNDIAKIYNASERDDDELCDIDKFNEEVDIVINEFNEQCVDKDFLESIQKEEEEKDKENENQVENSPAMNLKYTKLAIEKTYEQMVKDGLDLNLPQNQKFLSNIILKKVANCTEFKDIDNEINRLKKNIDELNEQKSSKEKERQEIIDGIFDKLPNVQKPNFNKEKEVKEQAPTHDTRS